MALLNKAYIIRALERLGELAHQSGYSIELVVVGGAAMVLLYDADPLRTMLTLLSSPLKHLWSVLGRHKLLKKWGWRMIG